MEISTLTCPICPHCGVEKVSYELISQCQKKDPYSLHEIYYQLWKCGNCEKPACSYSCNPMQDGGNRIDYLYGFYPIPEMITAPYGVPENMANLYKSAKRYLRSGKDADYDAACMMARKGIELAVKEFGGSGKDLFQKINNLEEKRLIPPALRDWAQHLRDIGNNGAHEPIVSNEEAQQADYFAEMLFSYLYSLPKRMEEYQQKS